MAHKILLADDSVTAQNLAKKILTDAGYDVVAVSNGAAALKRIASDHPDLMILDVYMPGYSGLEVCEKIRATVENSKTPVLLTVAPMEPFRAAEGNRVGADGVIVKPFESRDLLPAVEKLLESVSLRAAANGAGSGSESNDKDKNTPKKEAAAGGPGASPAIASQPSSEFDESELEAMKRASKPVITFEVPKEVAEAPVFGIADFEPAGSREASGPAMATSSGLESAAEALLAEREASAMTTGAPVLTLEAEGFDLTASAMGGFAIPGMELENAPSTLEGFPAEFASHAALDLGNEAAEAESRKTEAKQTKATEVEATEAESTVAKLRNGNVLDAFSVNLEPKLPEAETVEVEAAVTEMGTAEAAEVSNAAEGMEAAVQAVPAGQDPNFMSDRTEMVQFATHFGVADPAEDEFVEDEFLEDEESEAQEFEAEALEVANAEHAATETTEAEGAEAASSDNLREDNPRIATLDAGEAELIHAADEEQAHTAAFDLPDREQVGSFQDHDSQGRDLQIEDFADREPSFGLRERFKPADGWRRASALRAEVAAELRQQLSENFSRPDWNHAEVTAEVSPQPQPHSGEATVTEYGEEAFSGDVFAQPASETGGEMKSGAEGSPASQEQQRIAEAVGRVLDRMRSQILSEVVRELSPRE